MKTARKFICVLLPALLSALLLSSCGASGYVGTWHCEAGDADFQMELTANGKDELQNRNWSTPPLYPHKGHGGTPHHGGDPLLLLLD